MASGSDVNMRNSIKMTCRRIMRKGVAANPSTPVELLKVLAEDVYTYVRQGVAANPSTPVELLFHLL